jgi:hypothetical protein
VVGLGHREHAVVTLFGVVAVTFMVTMYALESRGKRYVYGFAVGCVLSSIHGLLCGAWPFGVVELLWAGIAVRKAMGLPGTATH